MIEAAQSSVGVDPRSECAIGSGSHVHSHPTFKIGNRSLTAVHNNLSEFRYAKRTALFLFDFTFRGNGLGLDRNRVGGYVCNEYLLMTGSRRHFE